MEVLSIDNESHEFAFEPYESSHNLWYADTAELLFIFSAPVFFYKHDLDPGIFTGEEPWGKVETGSFYLRRTNVTNTF